MNFTKKIPALALLLFFTSLSFAQDEDFESKNKNRLP
jgi:hypothetical protein